MNVKCKPQKKNEKLQSRKIQHSNIQCEPKELIVILNLSHKNFWFFVPLKIETNQPESAYLGR